MTLSLPLRDADGQRDPDAIQHALERSEDLIRTDPRFGSQRIEPATLGAALDFACDPETTRAWEAGTQQLDEWRRARREVIATVRPEIPLDDLRPIHAVHAAQSALARLAAGGPTPEQWHAHLAAIAPNEHTRTPQAAAYAPQTLADVSAAYRNANPRVAEPRALSVTWAARTAELLRAMLRHAATEDPARFGAVKEYNIPRDLRTRLKLMARMLAGCDARDTHQPRYSSEECRRTLRVLTDPRHEMRAILATEVNAEGALRTRRSELRRDDGRWSVRRNGGSEQNPQLTWRALGARASAALDALLAGPYATVEAAAHATGRDYRLVSSVRWNGVLLELTPSDEATPDANVSHAGLVGPRERLAFLLGLEGRAGQLCDARRSHLRLEGHEDELLLQMPRVGNKRGPVWLLGPVQQRALAFEMEVGYLAELEREFRDGAVADYCLFPQGRLRNGRAEFVRGRELVPTDERTIKDWLVDVESAAEIPHEAGRGQYGFRRAFVDLYDSWRIPPLVANLITGHLEVRVDAASSVRERVYLDRTALHGLKEARRVMEHARTVYVATGAPLIGMPPDAVAARHPAALDP